MRGYGCLWRLLKYSLNVSICETLVCNHENVNIRRTMTVLADMCLTLLFSRKKPMKWWLCEMTVVNIFYWYSDWWWSIQWLCEAVLWWYIVWLTCNLFDYSDTFSIIDNEMFSCMVTSVTVILSCVEVTTIDTIHYSVWPTLLIWKSRVLGWYHCVSLFSLWRPDVWLPFCLFSAVTLHLHSVPALWEKCLLADLYCLTDDYW
jgi:hypothetical protein